MRRKARDYFAGKNVHLDSGTRMLLVSQANAGEQVHRNHCVQQAGRQGRLEAGCQQPTTISTGCLQKAARDQIRAPFFFS